MAYSWSKRIPRDSVQSENFPEDPISPDMSATASEKANSQAQRSRCRESIREGVQYSSKESTTRSSQFPYQFCGGNDFDCEDESVDEGPGGEE